MRVGEFECAGAVTHFVIVGDRSVYTMCEHHYNELSWVNKIRNGWTDNGDSIENVRELTLDECEVYRIMNC
jgi:hypothetical protein